MNDAQSIYRQALKHFYGINEPEKNEKAIIDKAKAVELLDLCINKYNYLPAISFKSIAVCYRDLQPTNIYRLVQLVGTTHLWEEDSSKLYELNKSNFNTHISYYNNDLDKMCKEDKWNVTCYLNKNLFENQAQQFVLDKNETDVVFKTSIILLYSSDEITIVFDFLDEFKNELTDRIDWTEYNKFSSVKSIVIKELASIGVSAMQEKLKGYLYEDEEDDRVSIDRDDEDYEDKCCIETEEWVSTKGLPTIELLKTPALNGYLPAIYELFRHMCMINEKIYSHRKDHLPD
ncbi:MAG: hypothetical protein AABY22_31525, partial [Nanoarchaeota archaeon]